MRGVQSLMGNVGRPLQKTHAADLPLSKLAGEVVGLQEGHEQLLSGWKEFAFDLGSPLLSWLYFPS